MQVAAALREASKESQDWDAPAAQEVAAVRARGAQLPALVDRKQHRAEFPHRKAEQKQAEASREPHAPDLVEAAALAQAEVPTQHLPAVLGAAAAVSLDSCRERKHVSSTVLHGREGVTAARGSRLAVAAGVHDSGQLSITVALPSAAAKLWQQEPRENVNGIIVREPSCLRFRSMQVCRDDCCCECVVPVSCFLARTERNIASKFRSLWSLNHAVAWS